ncbi:hypothetical protein PISL3812_01761 [Talaromyces islandicus]|uniref:Uncharacterized protein n=1 Tax=Talaromyces islandicus TaxID=28573 RepID=A0A0U1LNM8_TALIS|nr:hypothetical protein PISL3812_01761 [Talaromyces islandicus]
MTPTRSASTWMSMLLLMLSLMPQSRAQPDGSAPDYNDPLAQSNTATADSGSNGSMGNKTRELIIILSVVIGVVVLVSVTSSILYVVAQRRQWNIRETIYQSARRVTDAVKSPLTTIAPPNDVLRPQRSRSSRGMTRLTSPRAAEMRANQQRSQPDRFEEAHKMPWEWGGAAAAVAHQHDKKENFDLERGIELASTGNMKITVSTVDSNIRSDSSSKSGWRGIFALSRR